ncbi:MAG: hypothetical protein ABFS34_01520 [Gemmatimonadota bacterium]
MSPFQRRWRVTRIACTLALGGAATACGDPPPAPPLGADSSAALVVRSPAPAWEDGGAWRIAEEPTFRLALGGRDERGRPPVTGAARTLDGAVFVLAPDGWLIRHAGRQRDTVPLPPEAGAADWLEAAPDGRGLLTFARRTGHAADLAADGSVRAAARLLGLAGAPQPILVGALDDGRWIATAIAPALPRTPGAARDPLLLLRYGRDGGPATVLDTLPGYEAWIFLAEEVLDLALVPFGRFSVVQVEGALIHGGANDAWSVDTRTADGALVRSAVLELPLRPVDEAEFDAMLRGRLRADPLEAKAEVASGTFEELPRPATAPAFGRILADPAGRLWLADFAPDGQAATTWTVLDADGSWLGSVALPDGLRLEQVGDDWVLGKVEVDRKWQVRVHSIER